ncbi:MAG TPA: signal peptidase II [Sphingobium sp.]|nr:signal peptidase II [Sphingobium sp.]
MNEAACIPNHRKLALSAAAVVLLLDQILKYIVTHTLELANPLTDPIRLTPFFNLTWAQNRGVSMGFFEAETDVMRWLLVLMLAGITTFVAWWLWRERNRDDALALGLILGGALGNIADRARLGYVVDYADFHIGEWRPFLIFNLADAAITIGVLILLARALLLREKAVPKETN